MYEKQISAATRENGKRQAQKLNRRRKKAAVAKALRSQKIKVGEPEFEMNIRGVKRTCFLRYCSSCKAKMMVQLGDLVRGRGKYCSQKCRAAANPNRRELHPNWNGGDTARKKRYRLRNPMRHYCRMMTHAAVGLGLIDEEPCEVCGERKSEAHHSDYSQPFLVRWLCRKHHVEAHGGYANMFKGTALLKAVGEWKECYENTT